MRPLALGLVTHLSALVGVRGMRREENQWIKAGCRLDLKGMSRSLRAGRGALIGALEVRAGLRENQPMTRSLLT